MPFFVSFLFLALFFFLLFAILPLLSSFPFLSLPSPAYKVASCLGAMLPCSRTLSYPVHISMCVQCHVHMCVCECSCMSVCVGLCKTCVIDVRKFEKDKQAVLPKIKLRCHL